MFCGSFYSDLTFYVMPLINLKGYCHNIKEFSVVSVLLHDVIDSRD